MHLISLDKKLFTVKHRLDKSQLEIIKTRHKLTKEQIQEEIQRELYQKFMKGIYEYIPTSVTPNPEGDEIYMISGYVLSQLAMLEVIKECLEVDEESKHKFLNEINNAITYRNKDMK